MVRKEKGDPASGSPNSIREYGRLLRPTWSHITQANETFSAYFSCAVSIPLLRQSEEA